MVTTKGISVTFLSLIFVGSSSCSAYLWIIGNKSEAVLTLLFAVVSLLGIIAWIIPERNGEELAEEE